MADEEESSTGLYGVLLSRFRDLEESHSVLRDQLKTVVNEKEQRRRRELEEEEEQRRRRRELEEEEEEEGSSDSDDSYSHSGWADHLEGFFLSRTPYTNVLQCMGHALHIRRPTDGKIIYWNRAAEKLYGWEEYEVIGERLVDLLIEDHIHASVDRVIEKLSHGQSWSGQLPFRKRSGEIFMALVTKSPLYEDDVLVGVITISSDAAIFNSIKPENARTYQDRADVHNKERRFNLKKIPWLPKPQIASSVSNLASKVFSRQRGDDENDNSPRANGRNVVELGEAEDMEPIRAGKQAAKFLQKLNIGEGDKEESQSTRVQSSFYYSTSNAAERASRYPIVSQKSSLERPDFRTNECEYSDCERIRNPNQSKKDSWIINKKPLMDSWLASQESRMPKVGNYMPQLGSEYYEKDEPVPDLDNLVEALEDKSKIHEKLEITQSPAVLISEESSGSSHENLTTKGDKFDCGILWEDLHLAEEVGQGSFAVVYRAIWNGSDVAVKVYIGSEYQEGTLLDYKKEVGIMQRLRHPNVLLFMGAVYSPERLAIVTEFLPRGSLFKTLHKSNQALDIKRRLRMALDVVRGMNYLHHRNPPILHRDLKSSNLLVDKNWTVKVGDFGLSKWKHATFVTAKSGRGTPQWMAPEVLRNEPSNEKSDVFSFGVILWELMTESIPWTQLNSLQVVGVVGFMDRRLEIPESLDPRLASIIHDCWQSEPNSRPSFKDLIPRVTDLIQTFPTVVPRKSPRS